MNGYLVDTNIPSELTRKRPGPAVEAFLKQAGKDRVYMSVLSLGEIVKGIISATVAERWGFLSAGGRLRGAPIAVVDGLLAATALEHRLTLVTRNTRDFADLGVAIVNPWERRGTTR